jgi:O-antigen/teichoic acid export membrane protein
VTALNLGQLGINSLASVFERAILVPLLPEFGRLLQKGDFAGMRANYFKSLRQIAWVVAAVATVLLAIYPVWGWLMAHLLRVPADTAHTIWWVCVILLPGLYVSLAGSSAVAVFYAFGETRVPVLIGIGGFAASLVLKGILFQQFSILGIAAGASLYLILNMVLYHVAVLRKLARTHQPPPSDPTPPAP